MAADDSGSFTVELTRQAEKDLKKYRAHRARVIAELSSLEQTPFAGHTLAGSLRGVRSLEFSLPDGAHRAGYYVMVDDQVCLVFAIGPRENFYKEAQRRYDAIRRTAPP